MPDFAITVKQEIPNQRGLSDSEEMPLQGLTIVLNAGNGEAGRVLSTSPERLGCSLGCEPDGTFPAGVPNPENAAMVTETVHACEDANADMGIMVSS